jgi:phosphoglycerate dehydrogenase-like enzyme
VSAPSQPSLVLYGEPIPADLRAIAEEVLPPGLRLRVVESRSRAELLDSVGDADFLLVATAHVDGAVLAAAPRLRLVQHQGVGYDNIDLAACRAAGVPVALTPEGTTIGVAEHTLLLILAVFKQLCVVDAAVRAGRWPVWELRSRSFELAGKTLGLVGFGRIGREVAKRARAFDAGIVYYDPVPAPAEVEAEFGVTSLPLDHLLQQSDVVSLHLPLTPATRGLIGERELGLMRPTGMLINTARGPLVDEPALAAALATGRIAGAGLDVFVEEPPAPESPLLSLPNAVLTPHIAAGTRDAYATKLRAAFANMARVARGEAPLHEVSA